MAESGRGHVASESLVGIDCFLGNHAGFGAVVKHRYSDFDVHEVDDNGKVVRLSSIGVRPESKNDERSNSDTEKANDPKMYEHLSQQEQSLFSAVQWAKLGLLASEKDESKAVVSLDVSHMSKEQRKGVHQALRTHFDNLVSDTKDQADGKKAICVSLKSASSKSDARWPSDRPRFLHFTMFKAFLDSHKALAMLDRPSTFNSKNSYKKSKGDRASLCICGTKDKRARTTQRVSAKYTTPEQIMERLKNTKLPASRFAVGDFEYKESSLNLGQHKGNHFTLALRKVADVESALKALETLKNEGFINYFGLQRFGTSEVLTSDVGLALIRRDFEHATDLVLRPRSCSKEPQEISAARRVYKESKDAKKALDSLGHRHSKSIEAHLLRGLIGSKKNFKDAFGWIPKNTRLMYLHAYQSLVWNKVVSKRLKKFGKQVLVGDIIKEDKEGHISFVDDVSRFTIYDVLMPLPGKSVEYPKNVVKELYTEVLAEDKLDLSKGFESHGINDGYALGGDYRRMIMRAEDLKWKVVKYDDPNIELIASDVDVINGIEIESKGSKLDAIVLEMRLSNSAYATMALREAMRTDTSIGTQKRPHEEGKINEEETRNNDDNMNGDEDNDVNGEDVGNGEDGESTCKRPRIG